MLCRIIITYFILRDWKFNNTLVTTLTSLVNAVDTLKQLIGQGTQHFTNIFVAERLGTANGLSCEWYLYNILSDATIGIFISWLLLRLISHLLADTALEYNSGDYGQNKDNSWRFKKFILQLAIQNIIRI